MKKYVILCMEIILGTGLILLIAKLAGSAKTLQNLIWKYIDVGIDPKKTNLKELVFNLKMVAINKNKEQVKFNFLKADVFWYGKLISKIDIQDVSQRGTTVFIPGGNESNPGNVVFKIPIRIQNLQTALAITEAIAAKKAGELVIDATIGYGGMTINHKETVKIEIPTEYKSYIDRIINLFKS